MNHAMNDREAWLRDALRTAAEQVEPTADGLERIQRRLRQPWPVPLAWLVALQMQARMRLHDALWTATDVGKDLAKDLVKQASALAAERFVPSHERDRRGLAGLAWLRPAAAMGIVVFIVAAVVYMAIEVPQAISPTSNATSHTPGTAIRSSGRNGSGRSTQTHGVSVGPGHGLSRHHGAGNGSCTTTLRPGKRLPTISASSPAASASPSTTTASATPTPTPSPSNTASPTPSTTLTVTPTGGAASGGAASTRSGAGVGTTSRAGLSKSDGLSPVTAHPASSPCPSPRPSKPTGGKKGVSPSAAGRLELPVTAAAEARTTIAF